MSKVNLKICPICKSGALVMGMKTGNINIYGCLTCRNAQGQWLKMKDAKAAWKAYLQIKDGEVKS